MTVPEFYLAVAPHAELTPRLLGAVVALLAGAAVSGMWGKAGRDRQARAALALGPPRGELGSRGGSPAPSDAVRPGRWRPRRRATGAKGQRARDPTTEEVAASMVLLAVALQSACGVVEAIEYTAEVAPPVPAAELGVVAAGLRWGVAQEQVWAQVDERWSRTALAMKLAREAGVAPSSLLLAGAEDLRSARLAAVDVAAARLGVRLVIPLGVAFLPAFVLTTVVPVVLALARQVLAS